MKLTTHQNESIRFRCSSLEVNLGSALGAASSFAVSALRLRHVEGGARSKFLPPMMSDTNLGTVQVPLTGEGETEGKVVADSATAQSFKNDPATLQADAAAETPTSGFVSVATMPVSDDLSSQLKEAPAAALSSPKEEGEDLQQPQSSGGIAFLTSLSAEALQEFDMPEYVKRHNATLTFPEKVRMLDDFPSIG